MKVHQVIIALGLIALFCTSIGGSAKAEEVPIVTPAIHMAAEPVKLLGQISDFMFSNEAPIYTKKTVAPEDELSAQSFAHDTLRD
jgi:hypothetical protein